MTESGIKYGDPTWKDNRGWLSAGDFANDNEQVLQDGYYYQQFSYEVKSSISINRFDSIVKELLHPAGVAIFGKVIPRDDLTVYHLRGSNYSDLVFDEDGFSRGTSGRPFDSLWRSGDILTITGTDLNDGQVVVDTVSPTRVTLTSGSNSQVENPLESWVSAGSGLGILSWQEIGSSIDLILDNTGPLVFPLEIAHENPTLAISFQTSDGFGYTWKQAELDREADLVQVQEWDVLVVTDFDTRQTERFLFVDPWEVDVFKIEPMLIEVASTTNMSFAFEDTHDLSGETFTWDFYIDWGDGTPVEHFTDFLWRREHIYAASGTYLISISGPVLPNIRVYSTWVTYDLQQWGSNKPKTLYQMFNNSRTYHTISATDAPDLSECTSLSLLFYYSDMLTTNGHLNTWDTSNIQDFSNAFNRADVFNDLISNWSTASATKMSGMFYDARKFNSPIPLFDVSGVDSLSSMFQQAYDFNQDISGWDTSNITSMASLFNQAYDFNQDLSGWDVSKVTTMSNMFRYATSFNSTWSIAGWVTDSLTYTGHMFEYAHQFNDPIGGWNMSGVTSVDSMFESAGGFNQSLSGWDVSKVTSFNQMFYKALTFNGDVSGWVTTSATNMIEMFRTANAFDQPINHFDVSGVTGFRQMFAGARVFNQDLDLWDMSGCATYDYGMSQMFQGALAFNGSVDWDLSGHTGDYHFWDLFAGATSFNHPSIANWDVSNAWYFESMFYDAWAFNVDISGWTINTTPGRLVDFSYMFQDARAFNQPIGLWDTTEVINMQGMFNQSGFNQSLENWNVAKVTNMYYMFAATTAYNQTMNTWDTSAVTYMYGMFADSVAFDQSVAFMDWTSLPYYGIDNMFDGAVAFNQDIASQWDLVNSPITSLYSLFSDTVAFNQDLSAWDVSTIDDFGWMFHGAVAFNQDLSAWTFGALDVDIDYMFGSTTAFNSSLAWDNSAVLVLNINAMFKDSLAFNHPSITGWDTSKVDIMSSTFRNCIFNQDISSWDVSAVTNMYGMFWDNNVFDQNISGDTIPGSWEPTSCTQFTYFMLNNNAFSTANYDKLLNEWSTLVGLSPNEPIHFNVTNYTIATSQAARDILTTAPNSWSISDAGGI